MLPEDQVGIPWRFNRFILSIVDTIADLPTGSSGKGSYYTTCSKSGLAGAKPSAAGRGPVSSLLDKICARLPAGFSILASSSSPLSLLSIFALASGNYLSNSVSR